MRCLDRSLRDNSHKSCRADSSLFGPKEGFPALPRQSNVTIVPSLYLSRSHIHAAKSNNWSFEGSNDMQDGSVTIERRKHGPAVWSFRWREAGPDGRRVHRRIVLGSTDDLKSLASARRMALGLRREINANDIRVRNESITLNDLSMHYQQRELVARNLRISHSTKRIYGGYLKKWIEPRCGSYALSNIRSVEVELWLKNLNLAPGSRCKIRNVMSLLFNHGRRYDLCERNPIEWVRQSAKRRTSPDVLTTDEVQRLLANLRFREHTLVLLAVTTGLRRSEIFALKWKDVDSEAKQIHVTRSIVQNVVGICGMRAGQESSALSNRTRSLSIAS